MRIIKTLLLVIAVALASASCSTSKKAGGELDVTQLEVAQTIRTLLKSGNYTVMVGTMRPLSGPTMSVTQGRKIILRDGVLSCALPYAGSAMFAGYGASGYKAMDFTGKIADYKVEFPKENKARVSFKVNNGDDEYKFHLEVFMNGKTTIDVIPRGRDAISYSGMFHSNDILN